MSFAKVSIAQSIAILRRRFPGALVCIECARLIASTPAGYAKSNLAPEQIEACVCAGCRYDASPAKSREISERFALAKKTAEAARLRAALSGLSPCQCTDRVTCASCLQTRATEAAEGRRVSRPYRDTCLVSGHDADLDALADCPHPSATVAAPRVTPQFCSHAQPAEDCVVHSTRPAVTAPMPGTLARCAPCLGYHGKDGQDRCPYNRAEIAAVKAAREAARGASDLVVATPENPSHRVNVQGGQIAGKGPSPASTNPGTSIPLNLTVDSSAVPPAPSGRRGRLGQPRKHHSAAARKAAARAHAKAYRAKQRKQREAAEGGAV